VQEACIDHLVIVRHLSSTGIASHRGAPVDMGVNREVPNLAMGGA
jgi:hypothetical protein